MAWLLKSPAGDANHDTPARLFLPNNRVMQLPAVGSVFLASVLGLPTVPWNLRLAASGMRREYPAFVPMQGCEAFCSSILRS